MSDKTAKLELNGTTIELPIYEGTLGYPVINVEGVQAQGYFTYDPGFKVTAPVESKITYIDGDKGQLLHRGYPIDVLAEHSNYLESCYLILHGELPTQAQYEEFETTITRHTMVHESIHQLFEGFHHNAHPMAKMCGAVGSLSAIYHDDLDISNSAGYKNGCPTWCL